MRVSFTVQRDGGRLEIDFDDDWKSLFLKAVETLRDAIVAKQEDETSCIAQPRLAPRIVPHPMDERFSNRFIKDEDLGPVLRASGIRVEYILERLGSGETEWSLCGRFPELSLEDIKYCLRYYKLDFERARSPSS